MYVGKVGSGFDERGAKAILAELKKLKETKRLIKEKPPDDSVTVWVEPTLVCEVQYSSIVSTGLLREPVFLRMRPDVPPEDCQEESPRTTYRNHETELLCFDQPEDDSPRRRRHQASAICSNYRI